MIFLTVGTQLPFNRLIKYVDEWSKGKEERIFAQIGKGDYIPSNFLYKRFLKEKELDEILLESRLIVSHAGMGTIIKALQNSKPIIVMPRQVKFKEHRNDHQLYTVKALKKKGLIDVAFDEKELRLLLDSELHSSSRIIGDYAQNELLTFLYNIINK